MASTSNVPPADPEADEIFVGQSEMATLMRAFDWSATSLGPVSRWPQSLRAVVRLMLTSRFAMWLGWGEELTFFYNDAYGAMTLGAKHPWALGQPSSLVWREIWAEVKPRIDAVLESGVATWDEKLLLFLERSGYQEETYHTFSYSPALDDDGVIRGNFCVVTEETERVIGERRLALLKELASQLATTNTAHEVCEALARSLRSDDRDLPFSLTYLAGEQGALALGSHTGLASDHGALRASTWPLAEVIAKGSAVVVTLHAAEAWPRGSWSRPPSQALAIPIAQQGQAGPAGVFIAGINPHRPLDETYRSFLTLLVAQLAAGLSNARAHEQERRRAESLAELDRAKTAFFSNVSHELRTPLTLMLSPLDELRRSAELPAFVREELELVQRNGLRLLRLVNTLLDFSRIEAGRAQARYEPTDLAGYTADLASVFRSAIERAGLSLTVDCPPAGAVYVDRSMWEKIVLNLVSNAFKYTFEGSIEVKLRVRGGTAELSVRDTGTGIPEHEMPRLFERFHRVEGALGRTHEGTGIGLALVAELVRLHAGRITAESKPDHGSTFTVAIPLGRDHLPAEHVHDGTLIESRPAGAKAYVEEALHWIPRATSGEESSAELAAHHPSSARRVLLADDSADMCEYIRRLLSPLWEIETVGNGREALGALRRKRPALLIADVMMPELDGFGLLAAIRADPQLRDLPVVMLSARAGEEARLEGLEAGADEYLVKPFTGRELIRHVEAQLMRARMREMERALERRLTSVFEHAPVAIALLRGPDHVYELANPSYLALIGHRPVVGQPLREALPELVDQGIFELLDGVFRTGEPFRTHSLAVTLNRGPNGEPEQCVFDFVYHPMRDAEGEVEGIAVVAYDVTELAVARKQAEVASVAKDEFLAMLGHELRNPLAPIMTALQLIKERRDGGADREHRIIERQVNHLVTLLDDLLDVSRITRGKLQLHKRSIELYEILAKAIETASPLLEKQRHTLHLDVPREGLAVHADPARMAQVFGNLLINAAKYTPEGGVIAIAGAAEHGEAIVRVTDNGIGIAQEMLPRVFEMFVQERQALARTQGGLGLGLAIVDSIVKLHEGAVSAHSEGPGKGTEICVRLPLVAAPRASQPALAPSAQRVPIKGDKRVLIVDDNEDVALMVSELLRTWGYDTRFAHDAMAAVALAERFVPDVAVLDIGLPVLDGYELAKRFAQHPKLAHTRLVAVTGYGQEQDRKLARAAGFAAHLVKPVDPERLREVIDQE